jgi:hypothetical protein
LRKKCECEGGKFKPEEMVKRLEKKPLVEKIKAEKEVEILAKKNKVGSEMVLVFLFLRIL